MISDLRNVVSVVQKGCYFSDITASRDLWHELLCLVNGRQSNVCKLFLIHLPLCVVRCLGGYYILQHDFKKIHL